MQSVLITGAARRVGRIIAKRFAYAGWRVVVHYRNSEDDARKLLDELPAVSEKHMCVKCDFMDMDAVSSLIPSLGIPLDCLVNNASEYSRVHLVDASPKDVATIFQVNFFAPFELMRSFARTQRNGCIVNITDQRTATVDPDAGPYGLAKKSLRDATEAAALDWAPNIRVNAVAPGIVMSPPGVPPEKMAALLPKVPLCTNASPEDVAEACIYLASARNVTGQTVFVDGGMHLQGFPLETKKGPDTRGGEKGEKNAHQSP